MGRSKMHACDCFLSINKKMLIVLGCPFFQIAILTARHRGPRESFIFHLKPPLFIKRWEEVKGMPVIASYLIYKQKIVDCWLLFFHIAILTARHRGSREFPILAARHRGSREFPILAARHRRGSREFPILTARHRGSREFPILTAHHRGSREFPILTARHRVAHESLQFSPRATVAYESHLFFISNHHFLLNDGKK
jgi:hypothetical protein